MEGYHDQLCEAVCMVLLEQGFYTKRQFIHEDRITVAGLGHVRVTLTQALFYDIDLNWVKTVELADPECFDKLIEAIDQRRGRSAILL